MPFGMDSEDSASQDESLSFFEDEFQGLTAGRLSIEADEMPLTSETPTDLDLLVPEVDLTLDTTTEGGSESSVRSSSSPEHLQPIEPQYSLQVLLPKSTLTVPKCFYEPFEPGVPVLSERLALKTLVPIAKESSDEDADFFDLRLDQFVVYLNTPRYGVEMRSLHQLDTKVIGFQFFFAGILTAGDQSFFVKNVPIRGMPIDKYGLDEHTVRDSIWLESPLATSNEIYYRLGEPAPEYERFFKPFLWLADFTKHVVDYLATMWEEQHKVSIHDFRQQFVAWIKKIHGESTAFQRWLSMHPSLDYRTSVGANPGFLFKEAIGVLGEEQTYFHKLWDEIHIFQHYNPPDLKHFPWASDEATVVTPYIYKCFQHLPFGDHLKAVPFSDLTNKLRGKLMKQRIARTPQPFRPMILDSSADLADRIRDIRPGDTISTHRDTQESGTQWKRETSRDFQDVDRWFARVHSVHVNQRGKRFYDVSWYYRPIDTLCGVMKYPWNNELFISDHCSCAERYKITEDEVLGVHDVEFHGDPTTKAELFCRFTYIHEERKWVTLQQDDPVCEHVRDRAEMTLFKPGETVLVQLYGETERSEPCEIVSFDTESDGKRQKEFTLRRLRRRSSIDGITSKARANELVYTDEFVIVKEGRIIESCHVRFFSYGTPIKSPYDRNGVGNLFILTHGQVVVSGESRIEPLTECPKTLRQGPDPDIESPKLRGLDLFCGGGNFGRGLEEGGAIKMHWVNDYASEAIHTYMANVESPEDVHPFLGSIDALQRLAIEGHFAKNVPSPGEVDFISGGSPCPGFSRLTNDKTTLAQRKNQSLVAAFASTVDLYQPQCGLLENVPGIIQTKANRDQDVFSQLICALVGLGYQTQFYFLDASSCGSPQSRGRVFITFAAPDFKLPEAPSITHSYPKRRNLSLGRLPNGEPMAERRLPETTPFKFVSAAEATDDLPPLYDATPDICVPFPDHRVSLGQTRRLKLQMYHIPNRPFGLNFATSWFGPSAPYKSVPRSGPMTESERHSFFSADNNSTISRVRPNSQAYGRQRPNGLMGTIVTGLPPGDAKKGRSIHWHENRVLSIMEARRAQGFRDEDVLLGPPAAQYRIVGNSVARQVAVALGITFREAYTSTRRHFKIKQEQIIDQDITTDTDVASLAPIPFVEPNRRNTHDPLTFTTIGDLPLDTGATLPIISHTNTPPSSLGEDVEIIQVRKKKRSRDTSSESTFSDYPLAKASRRF